MEWLILYQVGPEKSLREISMMKKVGIGGSTANEPTRTKICVRRSFANKVLSLYSRSCDGSICFWYSPKDNIGGNSSKWCYERYYISGVLRERWMNTIQTAYMYQKVTLYNSGSYRNMMFHHFPYIWDNRTSSTTWTDIINENQCCGMLNNVNGITAIIKQPVHSVIELLESPNHWQCPIYHTKISQYILWFTYPTGMGQMHSG